MGQTLENRCDDEEYTFGPRSLWPFSKLTLVLGLILWKLQSALLSAHFQKFDHISRHRLLTRAAREGVAISALIGCCRGRPEPTLREAILSLGAFWHSR
jgi:hypothetical protein